MTTGRQGSTGAWPGCSLAEGVQQCADLSGAGAGLPPDFGSWVVKAAQLWVRGHVSALRRVAAAPAARSVLQGTAFTCCPAGGGAMPMWYVSSCSAFLARSFSRIEFRCRNERAVCAAVQQFSKGSAL